MILIGAGARERNADDRELVALLIQGDFLLLSTVVFTISKCCGTSANITSQLCLCVQLG
jgi:hypothetical protein